MRALVFCLKMPLGVAVGSVLDAVSNITSVSEGSVVLEVGIDLAMAKKS